MMNLLWTVQLLFNLLIVLCLIVYIYTGDRKNRKKAVGTSEQSPDNSAARMKELAGAIEELVNAYDDKSQAALESIDARQLEIDSRIKRIQDLEESLRTDLEKIGRMEMSVKEEQVTRETQPVEIIDTHEEENKVPDPDPVRDDIPSLPRYREVMALNNQGVPLEQIARKLDIGVGEVRLVLDLQRRKSVIPDNMKGIYNNVKRRI
jgi:Family of unknown function (DUF6115)